MSVDDRFPAPTGPSNATADRTQALHRRSVRAPASRWKKQANQWMRWIHVYVSMFALLVILFFGLTGLTLNHPEWTFGDEIEQTTVTGTLPDSVVVDGELELLLVSEYLRDEHGVGGDVASFDTSTSDGSISYRGPGYGADALFEVESLNYTLTVQQQGFVAVMNDIHRGSETGTGWRWVIDISAGALVVVAATGLGIQFLMRKRRTRAFIVAGAGSVVAVLLIWIATR